MCSGKTRFKCIFYLDILFFHFGCNDGNKNRMPYTLVRINATEFKYEMPDTLASGYNLIRLINTGKLWHEAAIFKFANDEFSIGDYVDDANKGIDFPSFSIDIGGPGMTIPNDSNEVILNLAPGKYGIVCTIDNHLMAGMNKEFYVSNKKNGYNDPPKENVILTLSDSGFNFSKPVHSGHNLIKIINRGPQNHEVDFIKFFEGKTKDDYIKWVHKRNENVPGLPVGGTLDIVAGTEVWLPVELEKGNYYLSCMVPDVHTGKMHLDKKINGDLIIK